MTTPNPPRRGDQDTTTPPKRPSVNRPRAHHPALPDQHAEASHDPLR
jgi:hypothetical protein